MNIECLGFSKNGNNVTIQFEVQCSEISEYQSQIDKIEELAQTMVVGDKLSKFRDFFMINGGIHSDKVNELKGSEVSVFKVHIDAELSELCSEINKLDPRKKFSFEDKAVYLSISDHLEDLKNVCKDSHIRSENVVKTYKELINALASDLRKDREDLIQAYRILNNNPIVTQLTESSDSQEPMNWLLIDVGGKKATGNDHTFARWFASFETHMNRWMRVNINQALKEVQDLLVDTLKTAAQVNAEESIHVHKFISALIGLQALDLSLREGEKLVSFAYSVSNLGQKVHQTLPIMNETKKRIDSKIEQIMDMVPEFKPESIMCVNNITVAQFLDTSIKELVSEILCNQENNTDMPDVNYISHNLLKKMAPQVAKQVTAAGEVFISKTIDESKYLKDLHSIVKALPNQKGPEHERKTHMIVGISSPGNYQWEVGPFLSKFCDSFTRKETLHSILVNPDIPGLKAQKVCSIDYSLKWTEMRIIRKK